MNNFKDTLEMLITEKNANEVISKNSKEITKILQTIIKDISKQKFDNISHLLHKADMLNDKIKNIKSKEKI